MGLFKKITSFFTNVEDEEVVDSSVAGAVDTDAMWADVVSKLENVKIKASHSKGKAYMIVASPTHKKSAPVWYCARYSTRAKLAYVCIETNGGAAVRDAIMAIVETSPKGHVCRLAKMEQGSRSKEKWELTIATPIDKPTSELVKWYTEMMTEFYGLFEAAEPIVFNEEDEKAAAEKAERDRARAEADKAADERIERIKAEAEKEKAEIEQRAKAAEEATKAMNERLEAEAEKRAAEIAESAKAQVEATRAEIERIKAEKARLEAEKAKVEAEKAAAEKAAAEKAKAEVEKTQPAPETTKSNGELPGRFTINSRGAKICFSRGLLQFNPAKYEFRFAENQYDTIGKDNEKIAPNYDGWIDLFGWGTSGFMGCQPTETSKNCSDYGTAEGDIAGTNYDWGVYNPIANGGNKEGLWRTPTSDEWSYLMNYRPNATKLKVKATVCGITGYMIMPDDFWNNRLRMPLDITADECYVNKYNAEQWSQLETLGVVFMPMVGHREGKEYDPGWLGIWLSERAYSKDKARYGYLGGSSENYISHGRGVRLIKDVK